jgi:surface antigen
MKRWFSSGLILVFAVTLAGCAGRGRSGGITKETGGTVLGGIAGGLYGSRIGKGRGRTVATIAGAILGGVLGGAIGKQLDERDRLLMARTTQTSLEKSPSGRSTEWRNPDTGNAGTITPEPSYKTSKGDTCRPYTQTIQVGGKNETAKGTACRNPHGTWRIIR